MSREAEPEFEFRAFFSHASVWAMNKTTLQCILSYGSSINYNSMHKYFKQHKACPLQVFNIFYNTAKSVKYHVDIWIKMIRLN